MSPLAGIIAALLLLAVYGLALRAIWRVPFRALGILVAGMAFHNFAIMLLLRLGTPGLLIRLVQAWKEGILLLLFALALRLGLRAWRARRFPRPHPVDLLMAAFTLLVLFYFALPNSLLHTQATFTQRLVAARVLLLLPALYLFGRLFLPARRRDLVLVLTLIGVSAAAVGLLGMVELWFIPTRAWLDLGVNQLSAWFGFAYHGPQGLPENFFHFAGQGLYLRRMVSTYVSPLPIAYAGLLIVPLAVGLLLARSSHKPLPTIWLAAVLTLVVAGMLFSITRLALFILVAELLMLAFLWRRLWLAISAGVVGVLVVFMIYVYPQFGPLVRADLQPVQDRPPGIRIFSLKDPSLLEHRASLAANFQYVLRHPLGGLGNSVHRFGDAQGTGESALFDVFGDLGVVGGVLYLAIYALVLGEGWRALSQRRDPLLTSLPAVTSIGGLALLFVTLTSDVWADLPVTFLFWWAAGQTLSTAHPAAGLKELS